MAKTNYNKMSKKTEEVPVETGSFELEQTTTEVVETKVEEPKVELKKGVVVNCSKLNVRKDPKANAEVIGTIDAGSKVTIYGEDGDFYKVGTTHEYCMKKFISVK